MIEGLLIIAAILLVIFYADMKSKSETIDKQDSQIRKLKGIENEYDKKQNAKYSEWYKFKCILDEVKEDELYPSGMKKEFFEHQVKTADEIFHQRYGYYFSDPFNEFPLPKRKNKRVE